MRLAFFSSTAGAGVWKQALKAFSTPILHCWIYFCLRVEPGRTKSIPSARELHDPHGSPYPFTKNATVLESVVFCHGHSVLLSVPFSCPSYSASSKPTTEFAEPRLRRVKQRSSPARGYKFRCVCSYMDGHYSGILMTGHKGTTNTQILYPLAGDDRRLTLFKRGCANSVVGLELADFSLGNEDFR